MRITLVVHKIQLYFKILGDFKVYQYFAIGDYLCIMIFLALQAKPKYIQFNGKRSRKHYLHCGAPFFMKQEANEKSDFTIRRLMLVPNLEHQGSKRNQGRINVAMRPRPSEKGQMDEGLAPLLQSK